MSKTTPPQLPGNPNYQPQQPVQYVQQVPPQQQVVVQPGYTFGKFCLHVLMFVGLSFVLVLGGCTLLMGGCAVAVDEMIDQQREEYNNMSEDEKKKLRQHMEENGTTRYDVDKVLGTSE